MARCVDVVYISCLCMWSYSSEKYLDLDFLVVARGIGGRMEIPLTSQKIQLFANIVKWHEKLRLQQSFPLSTACFNAHLFLPFGIKIQ